MNTSHRHLEAYLRSYPYYKLTAMFAAILLAYEIFADWGGSGVVRAFASDYPNLGALLAGLFYAFGFTSPLAVGAFLSMHGVADPLRAAVAGGLGAFFSDYLLLKFVRFSFADEFGRLKRQGPIRQASSLFYRSVPEKAREYLVLALAGLFIASPLPDEVGVTLLAGFSDVGERNFAVASFLLNAAGIFVLLSL